MRLFEIKIKLDKKQFHLFLRFVRYLFPYKWKWGIILLLSNIGALLTLINPYLSKLVIDKAFGNKELKTFFILGGIGAGVFVLTGILNGIKQYLEKYVKAKIRFDLTSWVFNKIQDFSLRWFRDRSTGENIYRVNYDIGRVESLITTVPPQAVAIFPKLFFILIIILRINWKMCVFAIVLTPFLYLPSYYLIKKRRVIFERLIKNSETIFKVLHETFSHIYPVKVFGKEEDAVKKYLAKLKENIKIELESTRFEIISGFISMAIDKIILGFITLYGGYSVIKGTMTLGSFTAIMVYLGQLVGMQSQFVMFYQTTVLGLVSCERVAGILDEENRIIEDKHAKEITLDKPNIVFNKVSFGYRENSPIIDNLSFSLPCGKHISLVALSGRGKTTMLNLILRLYDIDKGEILIEGNNIKNIKINSLKSQIGMALQEPFLFNDTIKNNILYARENATSEEMLNAARLSLVDEIAESLPKKYDTLIGENACKLSEGQKQKIAIARVLIKNPKILIFDEATSSMDSLSEEKIFFNIKDNYKSTTLITVSHRFSSVLKSDLVCFMKSSSEIVSGSYGDLVEEDKDFSDLFKSQIACLK